MYLKRNVKWKAVEQGVKSKAWSKGAGWITCVKQHNKRKEKKVNDKIMRKNARIWCEAVGQVWGANVR